MLFFDVQILFFLQSDLTLYNYKWTIRFVNSWARISRVGLLDSRTEQKKKLPFTAVKRDTELVTLIW